MKLVRSLCLSLSATVLFATSSQTLMSCSATPPRNQAQQEEIIADPTTPNPVVHFARSTTLKALSAGNIFVSTFGKFASYSSAGTVLSKVFFPDHYVHFIAGAASLAIIEKLGKVLYEYLDTEDVDAAEEQIDEIISQIAPTADDGTTVQQNTLEV